MSALQTSKAATKKKQKDVEVYIHLCCHEKKKYISHFSGDKDTNWHVYVTLQSVLH